MREAWPRMVPERSTVEKMFGAIVAKERWRSDLTLVESTARNDEEGNAYGALLKQGIAALLNSYARRSFLTRRGSNPEFQRTLKELKGKAHEFEGVKENLKVTTKEKTEKLYKQVDGVWTEAESVAKKVSSSVKDKFSEATQEIKESFKLGKEESASSSGTGTSKGKTSSSNNQALLRDNIHYLKNSGQKHLEYTPPRHLHVRSTRTDLVVTPTKQSKWQKKWESLREKMQGYPAFKRLSGMSEPVVNKSQEIAEDIVERWETSDNPIVHKIQDINEAVFNETDSGSTYKEIRRRDPSFSLTDFTAEVHDAIKPVLNAYSTSGDVETLKKYSSMEVIERCTAELAALKILHISEVEVEETKMMGTTPTIIVRFQTQQIFCVQDREAKSKKEDTIHSVYYKWAMQQVEAGEEAIYPIWRLLWQLSSKRKPDRRHTLPRSEIHWAYRVLRPSPSRDRSVTRSPHLDSTTSHQEKNKRTVFHGIHRNHRDTEPIEPPTDEENRDYNISSFIALAHHRRVSSLSRSHPIIKPSSVKTRTFTKHPFKGNTATNLSKLKDVDGS
ncbi:hypothetical protein Bca52824_078679 [Brassica carinata]|uniref:Tim44-like domain-containing protein n=1 Tax=Brassica carinata TaxID=52824 RepID=A0A8X7PX62_BRACI|nr:hypothetical protein Bca52824_078679 [Brassica carinata]